MEHRSQRTAFLAPEPKAVDLLFLLLRSYGSALIIERKLIMYQSDGMTQQLQLSCPRFK